MKKRVSSLLGIGLSVVAGWCSLTVALAALFSEEVDCCPVDQLQLRDPQVPRYPQNAQVTVYIDKRTGFTGPEKQAIKDGIENWNNQPNNSGVTFTFTPQPAPPAGVERNGFLALAEYDKPGNGGNGDGAITSLDDVFASLIIWQDLNHNGISEAAEINTPNGLGLTTIELNYKISQRTDKYGNRFLYRAKVKDTQGNQLGRWAWDVVLVTAQ